MGLQFETTEEEGPDSGRSGGWRARTPDIYPRCMKDPCNESARAARRLPAAAPLPAAPPRDSASRRLTPPRARPRPRCPQTRQTPDEIARDHPRLLEIAPRTREGVRHRDRLLVREPERLLLRLDQAGGAIERAKVARERLRHHLGAARPSGRHDDALCRVHHVERNRDEIAVRARVVAREHNLERAMSGSKQQQ